MPLTPIIEKLNTSPPLRVACLSTPQGLKKLSRKLPADLIEIRLDLLLKNGLPLHTLTSTLIPYLAQSPTPILLTPRHPSEGGQWPWKNETERIQLTLPLIPHATAIDLELAKLPTLAPLHRAAKKHHLCIILSAHSLTRPLTQRQILSITQRLQKSHPHIAKIAALAYTSKDLATLTAPLFLNPQLRWAIMATGPHALFARTLFTALGSHLLYGYLDQPTAPGQPSLAQINRLRDTLTPLLSNAQALNTA
jgi:3-dehydroquinate dehydratase-1